MSLVKSGMEGPEAFKEAERIVAEAKAAAQRAALEAPGLSVANRQRQAAQQPSAVMRQQPTTPEGDTEDMAMDEVGSKGAAKGPKMQPVAQTASGVRPLQPAGPAAAPPQRKGRGTSGNIGFLDHEVTKSSCSTSMEMQVGSEAVGLKHYGLRRANHGHGGGQ